MPPRLQQAAHSTGPLCRLARLLRLGHGRRRGGPAHAWPVAGPHPHSRANSRAKSRRPPAFARRRQARTQGRFDRAGLAGTLRFNSDSYQILSALAVSALPGFSSVQNPILAMMGKLSPRARKYVMTSNNSGTASPPGAGLVVRLGRRVACAAPCTPRAHGMVCGAFSPPCHPRPSADPAACELSLPLG
jgi:hypothetical protein